MRSNPPTPPSPKDTANFLDHVEQKWNTFVTSCLIANSDLVSRERECHLLFASCLYLLAHDTHTHVSNMVHSMHIPNMWASLIKGPKPKGQKVKAENHFPSKTGTSFEQLSSGIEASPASQSLKAYLIKADITKCSTNEICISKRGLVCDSSTGITEFPYSMNFPFLRLRMRRVAMAKTRRQKGGEMDANADQMLILDLSNFPPLLFHSFTHGVESINIRGQQSHLIHTKRHDESKRSRLSYYWRLSPIITGGWSRANGIIFLGFSCFHSPPQPNSILTGWI